MSLLYETCPGATRHQVMSPHHEKTVNVTSLRHQLMTLYLQDTPNTRHQLMSLLHKTPADVTLSTRHPQYKTPADDTYDTNSKLITQ